MQRPSTIDLAFSLLIASAGFGLLALLIPDLQTCAFVVASAWLTFRAPGSGWFRRCT